MALIEIKGVDYQYSSSREVALKSIDLSIEAGEFVTIIGANGSGKSTLAKLLNVLLIPSQGKVYIDGLNTQTQSNIWDIRQKVGMVLQNPDNQLVASIVEEDVAFGLENLGVPTPEIRKRVDRSLEIVGMDGYQRHTPHKLSGGQKQRVAIAGVIAMEPACIVLDEPTAMLDPRGRKDVMETVKHLNNTEGITVIHITHFMEEAIDSDRILVMNDGKIVKSGSPELIFSDIEYLNRIDLDVPPVIELAETLREHDISLAPVLSIDELVDELC